MKINEILAEARKKPAEPKAGDTTSHDYNPGWEELNWFKEQALLHGNRLAQRGYQLFIPRRNLAALTPRDRRLQNIASGWAYDDEGNIKQSYADWEKGPKELSPTGEVDEAAPIMKVGAKSNIPPGNNKPVAQFWTSTAIKLKNGGWTSAWGRLIENYHRSWMSPIGYLYKVTPGALVLELDDYNAERLKHAFAGLGRTSDVNSRDRWDLSRDFPWQEVNKHFDAVRVSYPNEGFTYGWDVESTAWLNTEHLTFVAEVPIGFYDEDY